MNEWCMNIWPCLLLLLSFMLIGIPKCYITTNCWTVHFPMYSAIAMVWVHKCKMESNCYKCLILQLYQTLYFFLSTVNPFLQQKWKPVVWSEISSNNSRCQIYWLKLAVTLVWVVTGLDHWFTPSINAIFCQFVCLDSFKVAYCGL